MSKIKSEQQTGSWLFHIPDSQSDWCDRLLKQKWYDARYVNISERGEPMISKNEVIIANCLNKYKKESNNQLVEYE